MKTLLAVGTQVRVRTATGEQRCVRVTGAGPGVVYVTSEDEYQSAVRESREPEPFIGFPNEDVLPA
jgi:hypothetical protein